MEDYLSSDYDVVKPHGSINWAHQIDAPPFDLTPRPGLRPPSYIRDQVIDKVSDLKINPSFEFLQKQQINTLGMVAGTALAPKPGTPMVPALSIPVVNKAEYECPSSQEETMLKDLRSVDKVLVIGWRAAETRFLKSFVEGSGRNHPQVMVVSRSKDSAERIAQTIRSGFRDAGLEGDYIGASGGFSEMIKAHGFDSFLKN